ncbi:IMP cyclohydrolase [bacterium 3DAC]|nr:IMP cyclohydrolase [Dictyoglomota bacterium]UZN22997.1 IMP cyclohydrolase [bacterium 3DAC]
MYHTALLSVSNKSGIVPFAKVLHTHGIKIISTGGTAELLCQNNIPVLPISSYTGFPEIMGGRVKTLHPKVFGGILARRHLPGDMKDLEAIGGQPIDIVVVNLYPFEKMSEEKIPEDRLLEYIDIGGVSLIRAAAKNYQDVIVLIDPSDYEVIVKYIQQNKEIPIEIRKQLALKAFRRTYMYDKAIYETLTNYSL